MIHDEPTLADDGLHVAGVEGITEVPGEVVLRQRRGGIVVEDDQIVRPAARRIVALDVRVYGAEALVGRQGDMPPSASPAMK